MILTVKLRLRDKHAAELNRQARAVNVVWNYCNETQQKAARSRRQWLSDIDLQRLTAGSSTGLGIHAHTVQKVCQTYHHSRMRHRRAWLRFRGRKSLGWVPFNQGQVRIIAPGKVKFRGMVYETMHWRDCIDGVVVRAGSFNRDARGRWYISIPYAIDEVPASARESSAVGIDLGLKSLATLSTGDRIVAPKYYRKLEAKLGGAQRARKVRLQRSVWAKIRNARKDYLHKASTAIALAHSVIVVGDVSTAELVKTSMAKSILDAGWSPFRKQLSYKALRHGGTYIEVDEAYTTQVCSACGALPEGRPEGIANLGIREWTCGGCGATHDRDVNAARNILRLGLETLEAGAQTIGRSQKVRLTTRRRGPYTGRQSRQSLHE